MKGSGRAATLRPSAEQQLSEAAHFLTSRSNRRPTVGIILGSGLACLADDVTAAETIQFVDIPHLAQPTAAGHPGALVLGELGGVPVAVLQGRLHYYEGYSPWQVTFPVRLLAVLGVRTLIATNASGSLNPAFQPGDLMLITDHINLPGLVGANPLRGLSVESFGVSFVDMAQAYDSALRSIALSVGHKLALSVQEGVYAMVAGPSYETGAELAFLRSIGADAVGMSTAPEVIVARQCGMQVLGLSCISNPAAGTHSSLSHEQVLAACEAALPRLAALIKGVVQALPESAR